MSSGELNFDERVVLVTGAGNGLGRAYAIELGKRGARVVVNDLGTSVGGDGASQSAAQATVDDIVWAGGQAIADFGDVSSPAAAQAMVDRAVSEWGSVDAVISNAGILQNRAFADLTEDDIDRMINIQLKGAFYVAQAAFRQMLVQGRVGRIVLTGSPAGFWGSEGGAHYAAAKGGLIGLTNSLASAGRPHGIATNLICPNAFTRMAKLFMRDSDLDAAATAPPLTSEQVVPIVVLLAHEQCPENGAMFVAGGGWFGRVDIRLGEGHFFGSGEVAAETLRDQWDMVNVQGAPKNIADMGEFGMLLVSRLAN